MLNYETVQTSGVFKIWERFQRFQAKLFLRSHLDGFVVIKILKYVNNICCVEFKIIIYFFFYLKNKAKTWPPFFKKTALYFSFFSFFLIEEVSIPPLSFLVSPCWWPQLKAWCVVFVYLKKKNNLDFNHFIYFTKLAPACLGLQLHGLNDDQGWEPCVFNAPPPRQYQLSPSLTEWWSVGEAVLVQRKG